MTHPGPLGPRPEPIPPRPTRPGAEHGSWPPQQPQPEGAWSAPQQGAWYPPQPQPQPQPQGPWAAPERGAWYPPQPGGPVAPGSPAGGPRRWLRIAVPIAVVGLVGLGSIAGFGDPEVGDCVRMQGATSFEVVDCGSGEAEYRIVGIEGEEQTYPDFMADPDTCAEFVSTEVALWIGGPETEPGTVFCAEPT